MLQVTWLQHDLFDVILHIMFTFLFIPDHSYAFVANITVHEESEHSHIQPLSIYLSIYSIYSIYRYSIYLCIYLCKTIIGF